MRSSQIHRLGGRPLRSSQIHSSLCYLCTSMSADRVVGPWVSSNPQLPLYLCTRVSRSAWVVDPWGHLKSTLCLGICGSTPRLHVNPHFAFVSVYEDSLAWPPEWSALGVISNPHFAVVSVDLHFAFASVYEGVRARRGQCPKSGTHFDPICGRGRGQSLTTLGGGRWLAEASPGTQIDLGPWSKWPTLARWPAASFSAQ